jgi:hypothetical protein
MNQQADLNHNASGHFTLEAIDDPMHRAYRLLMLIVPKRSAITLFIIILYGECRETSSPWTSPSILTVIHGTDCRVVSFLWLNRQ